MAYTLESDKERELLATQGKNWILASLFNLIVVADSTKQAIRCQEIVRLVTEKFPCRVFLIQADETSQCDFFSIEHSLQAVGDGKTEVCYDQIKINCSPNELKRAPFVILPRILPDLPVYVIVGHDPTQDKVILPELQKFATRIIFDSLGLMDNVQLFAERMLQTIGSAHNDYIDIKWAKTKAWREVVARVFHDKEKQELLSKSKVIQISYCKPSQTTAAKFELQAIYVQAWLAAQLGWSFLNASRENGSIKLQYHSRDLALDVLLVPKDTEALELGEIYSIEVLTHNDYHFLIGFEGHPSQVTVHASSPERCEIPYSIFISNYQKGTALVNEALYQPPSEHYVAMLHMLNNPAWKAL